MHVRRPERVGQVGDKVSVSLCLCSVVVSVCSVCYPFCAIALQRYEVFVN